jgi:hypothetical protein
MMMQLAAFQPTPPALVQLHAATARLRLLLLLPLLGVNVCRLTSMIPWLLLLLGL